MFDYDSWVNSYEINLAQARIQMLAIDASHDVALAAWYDSDFNYALLVTITGLGSVVECFSNLLLAWGIDHALNKVSDLAEGIRDDFTDLCTGEAYELTLQKMLGAYIAAPDLDRRSHRYLLDAFSASLYDKPFDETYHAEWVQRFLSWE